MSIRSPRQIPDQEHDDARLSNNISIDCESHLFCSAAWRTFESRVARRRRTGVYIGAMTPLEEKRIHRLFQISVLLKGAHAALEFIGGVFLYFISADTITKTVVSLVQEELIDDPNDIVANYLFNAAQQLSVASKTFAAFYLVSHGVVKLFLVAGLLRNKLWAYPASLAVLGLFIFYQMYRFTFTHSLGLIALTVFDLVVVVLIWHEYRLIRRHLPVE
jgi:uncharacterized membrane protein